MKNYKKYIHDKGSIISKNIKNNIYAYANDPIKLLLINYILDTLEHYDSRNCPDYIPSSVALVTEDINYFISTEDFQFKIATESIAYDIFTKIKINKILNNLTKDILCY